MSDLIKLAFLFGFQFTKNVQRKISIDEISSQNKMKSPMWPDRGNESHRDHAESHTKSENSAGVCHEPNDGNFLVSPETYFSQYPM